MMHASQFTAIIIILENEIQTILNICKDNSPLRFSNINKKLTKINK